MIVSGTERDSVGDITKNRSHLAGLNRVVKIFVGLVVVEGRGHVEVGELLRGLVLWRDGE